MELLSEQELRGIAEFNQREYYRCHETLELAWRPALGDRRMLLHGIIQVAVGLVHVERANFKGATSLLSRSILKLRALPPSSLGVDVASLLHETETAYATVLALGPMGIAKFPWEQAPVIRSVSLKTGS